MVLPECGYDFRLSQASSGSRRSRRGELTTTKDTVPGIFVVESTSRDNERDGMRERYALEEILNLTGRPVQHHHIRTRKELEEFVREFGDSKYRYLHLASHGCKEGIELTYDFVPFGELAQILIPVMDEKRLFISACDSSRNALARPLFRGSTCYSVIGPRGEPTFHQSAIAWAAFYTLMSMEDRKIMKRDVIRKKLQDVCNVFGVAFNAFFRVGKNSDQEVFRRQVVRRLP
jgi:hypothetical protein